MYDQEQAEQSRLAEEQRQEATVERRSRLVSVFSVECPHCSAPAGEICRTPVKKPQRTIHQDRQKLAGVHMPEFRIEATNPYTRNVPQPALDSDLRGLLGDPLKDRTQEATKRFDLEQQHAAELRLQRARRDLWIASGGARQAVEAFPCEHCAAEAGSPCIGQRGGCSNILTSNAFTTRISSLNRRRSCGSLWNHVPMFCAIRPPGVWTFRPLRHSLEDGSASSIVALVACVRERSRSYGA